MALTFKLKKANTLARYTLFEAQPSWTDLTSRIATLFQIPLEEVGVAWVDNAQDVITLTNENDLQCFYQSFKFGQSSEPTIKLVVHTPDGESDSKPPLTYYLFAHTTTCLY